MTQKRPCVYILASRRNGTLYIGVTADLARRVWQHRSNAVAGFVRGYSVYRLVFVEFHETMSDAILRESGSRNGGAPGSSNLAFAPGSPLSRGRRWKIPQSLA
jgi:putative endonuclease